MRAHCRAHGGKDGGRTSMEAIRATCALEDTLDVFADHVVPEEHPGEEEHPMQLQNTVMVSQATWRDAIASISSLIEEAVNALVCIEGQDGVTRTDNRLQTRLRRLANKTLVENLSSVAIEYHFLRKIR